ncbi:MAG: bifunctional tRNA (5-methylaminomethyl-2-thiouridine)(34)-methyltransferase MnmD/FAD-dependent 5-carboxymethylaminomethyl-2-thiouridine(34) oxidoreductase MnmC [Zoogloeaceae bacterium]|nr:bifunctional tRNA (5-methylaminomethyl-2-thiouridine)(34)-methyltransferase MnmD/FAD-dependent 5-carboxymethylaminomethyl-2-thiouridine(34) oxidoreductase MnmC [Rhodocyclaceae bacterium]MCP5232511.1 bifunctional tRNA (5-methylaminomethyl-2-thiouridine)(34)-methyltransferase MnmD/FAD-dependent 5-carboxymethylaminomethyl-2-thiouridine(34) oxidoreductase MnmC [Zoogloeaceae bacterium]MCP5238608.1 bifunctional tRNA (5-methylaminomethyl-2-thiouridine)(34)-methyltransferase MnmD/FAD-dependent 5-carbo
MYTRIQPATPAIGADGTPWSEQYGDVYHSHDGGLGQAQHVFLAGNGLPERWQGRARFVIVETGFGLGLNFLATWAAWRGDATRSARLHFISFEKHPFRAHDLRELHARWPHFAEQSGDLLARWPALTPGMHRLHLDDERVCLTLFFGDASDGLTQLDAQADALFLDGFSPARNPELWTPRICHLLARLCKTETTLATWSVSGKVREALGHAGFAVERAPGFAGKRQMLRGHYRGRVKPQESPREKHALVIGAGLAGSASANRLAARGWKIDIIDSAERPGQGASGNLAGVLRPLPSLDDNRLARLTRAGSLYGRRHLEALAASGCAARWDACGVLHLARDPAHETRQRQVVETQQPPSEHLRFVSNEEASAISGWPLPLGGWWFPGGGWVEPPSLCEANLRAFDARIRGHFGRTLARLERRDGQWHALAADGSSIASAPLAILANGVGIRAIDEAAPLPVRSARGQVSHLPAAPGSAPRVVVCRLGYVSPEIDGLRCAGATFLVDDDDPELRLDEHRDNLAKLDFILPGFAVGLDPASLSGRVGFRPASPDRLPMIGAVPTGEKPAGATLLEHLPRHPGLFAVSGFGARGLVWSSLAGELLASLLDGDALPLERDLVDAVDPARYLLKPARQMRSDD